MSNPPASGMRRFVLPAVAISLFVAALIVENVREQPSVAAARAVRPPSPGDFPGQWRHDDHVDIRRTLAAYKIEDCNRMAYRRHRTMPGEYLVYCSRNGAQWTAWLVFPGAQRVAGPYRPDPLLPKP